MTPSEQRTQALANANRIRTTRARLKAQVAAGTLDWTSLLDHPDAATMRLSELLRTIPKVGTAKTARILRSADVNASSTPAVLTARQRHALHAAFERHRPKARNGHTLYPLTDTEAAA